MPEIIWRPVGGHETHYEVSSFGRVRRVLGGRGATAGRIAAAVAEARREERQRWEPAMKKLHKIAEHLSLEIIVVPGTDDWTDDHMRELREALDMANVALTTHPPASAPEGTGGEK